MMKKTRLGIQFKEAILGTKSAHRNEHLMELSKNFDTFRAKLRTLVEALQSQYIAMKELNRSRIRVAHALSSLAQQTPISNQVGWHHNKTKDDDEKDATVQEKKQEDETVVDDTNDEMSNALTLATTNPSYLSIHRAIYLRRETYEKTFHEFIIQYIIAWEEVIVGRITSSLEHSESLRRDVDHYHDKIQSLQKDWTTSFFGKPQTPDAATIEKIERNKTKFRDASQLYDDFSKELCLLLEEVTERGWRDLLPLFIKLLQYDSSLASDEYDFMSRFVLIAEQVKKVAYQYEVKPEARLAELEKASPTLLSTKELDRNATSQNTNDEDSTDESGIGSFSLSSMSRVHPDPSEPTEVDPNMGSNAKNTSSSITEQKTEEADEDEEDDTSSTESVENDVPPSVDVSTPTRSNSSRRLDL